MFAAGLPADTPVYYSFSVILAYAVGIVLSYYGHRHFSFERRQLAKGTARRFLQFAAIAILGLLGTTALSACIRYGLSVDRILGPYGAGFAFAVATFAASILTYGLNSVYTFCAEHSPGQARKRQARDCWE
jgi:putative flippase GtrA